MKRKLSIVYLVMTATFAVGRLSAQGNQIPALAIFRDATTVPTDKIQSDGLIGAAYLGYPHGVNCVLNYKGTGGFYFLRTVAPNCTDPPVQRLVKVDFSNAITRTPDGTGGDTCHVNDALGQTGELNICGLNVPQDVRLIANTLFANSALNHGTTVTLYISLIRSFSGPAAFTLAYEQSQLVTAPGTNVRTLTAGPDSVAELYKTNSSNGQTISLGRFKMPFQLTVTAPVP